jgi:hypothetical protein
MSEHEHQVAVVEWARYNTRNDWRLGLLFAIPNGSKLPYFKNTKGKRVAPQAIKLLREGLLPGVCDLFLPAPNMGFNGLFVEMKYGNNKPSDEQIYFIDSVRKLGYKAEICYDADVAIEIIFGYLGWKGDPYDANWKKAEA